MARYCISCGTSLGDGRYLCSVCESLLLEKVCSALCRREEAKRRF